jgi:hypothetical protein
MSLGTTFRPIVPAALDGAATDRFVAVLCKVIIVWVAFGLFGDQLLHAYVLGNEQLTDSGDAYSEANDVRAGEAYADKGLTSNVGLPEISYGTKFESQGGKHDNLMCESTDKCVYLHYPPGPELAVGVMTKVFGKGHLFDYRFVPLVLSLSTLLLLGAALFKAIGPLGAAAVIWLLARVPMTSNMMHVFTTHSWSQAFFLLELSVLLYTFSQPTTRRWHLWAVGMAAFLEGWTAFDYVFLVALSPVAVFLAFKDIRNSVSRRRLLLVLAVVSGAYGLAIVMHFLQVAAFLGSVKGAFWNFAAAAKNRSLGPTWVNPPFGGGPGMILHYWAWLLPDKKFYDGSFIGLVATTIAVLWPKSISVSLGRLGCLRWQSGWSQLASFIVAVSMACGWLVTMQQHAGIHSHFVPRLFESVVVFAYVLVARSFSFKRSSELPRPADQTIDNDSKRTSLQVSREFGEKEPIPAQSESQGETDHPSSLSHTS